MILLEEKNKSLENELQNEKNKPPIIVERPVEKVFVPQNAPVEKNIVKDFFTIGSSEKEVIEVMGDPSEIIDFESMNEKWLHFGRSYVVLRNDKVKEYHNWENNLKVKIKNK